MLMVWADSTCRQQAFVSLSNGGSYTNQRSRQTFAICNLWKLFFDKVFNLVFAGASQLLLWGVVRTMVSIVFTSVFEKYWEASRMCSPLSYSIVCRLDAVVHRLSVWRCSGSGSGAIKWPDSRHGPAVEYSAIYQNTEVCAGTRCNTREYGIVWKTP